MSVERNVKTPGGSSFHHPPRVIAADEKEMMGPATLPEDRWTASVVHRPGASAWKHFPRDKPSRLFQELWDAQPPPVPNKMNPSTNVRRRHGTYGKPYEFGSPTHFLGPIEEAPELVRECVDWMLEYEGEYPGAVFAHVNWYPDHQAGIGAHKDNEAGHIPGSSVFSFSFFEPNTEAVLRGTAPKDPYRYFVFSQNREPPFGRQWPIPLYSGDVLIMNGACQSETGVYHRVPPGRKNLSARRINITVRFGEAPEPEPEPKRAKQEAPLASL